MTKIGVEFETVRCNYNLPKNLMERVKEYSRKIGVPITYGVVLLLNKGLEYDTAISELAKFNNIAQNFNNQNSDSFLNIEEKATIGTN